MSQSLCVVLPVRNAQSTLSGSAQAVLDALSELTGAFELLILDNGSTDATSDVAQEMADRFPQVRLARHGAVAGMAGVVRTTLAQTRCEQILLCDEGCALELADLHKLWPGRNDYDAVLAWPAGARATQDASYGPRLRAWRLRLSRPAESSTPLTLPGYQLLKRPVLERLRWNDQDRYELLAELSRQGFRWQVVEVRAARANAWNLPMRAGEAMRVDEQSPSISGPAHRRSRRLEAIKGFALGE